MAFDIWSSNPDGTDQKQVTDLVAVTSLTASADGSLIALNGQVPSGLWRIAFVSASGGTPQFLAGPGGTRTEGDPSFGPGTKLAFASDVSGHDDIRVADLASGSTASLNLTPGGTDESADPTFSPDGEHVAFIRTTTGSRELIVTNADGTGDERVITPTLAGWDAPDYMPDGGSLVVRTSGGGLAEIDADTGQLIRSLSPGGYGYDVFGAPSASPSGQYVVMWGATFDSNGPLYLGWLDIYADGSRVDRFTHSGGNLAARSWTAWAPQVSAPEKAAVRVERWLLPGTLQRLRRLGAGAIVRASVPCPVVADLVINPALSERLGLDSRVIGRTTVDASGRTQIRARIRQAVYRRVINEGIGTLSYKVKLRWSCGTAPRFREQSAGSSAASGWRNVL